MQQVKNTLNRADLSTDINQLNVLERTLNNLQHQLKVEKAIAQTSKGGAKAPEGKKGAGGFFQQLSDPSSKLGSAVIGAGFPALMGGGPGTILGGALGGAVGGFAGSIAASAVGQAFDDFAAAATEVGKSLAYPIEGFEKLKEASLFASREQEYYISKLIETGRVAEATAVIQAEMIKKIGVRGVNDLAALGDSTSKLSKEWAAFNLNLQAALAGPLAGLTAWLAGIIGEGNKIREGQAKVKDVRAGLSGKDLTEFNKRLKAIGLTGSEESMSISEIRKRYVALAKEFEPRSKPQIARGALTPEDQEKAIKAAEQQADTIKDAYRTGFRLQQQGIDLQRQGSDLQRRVAQDVYNKQQEILRLQVDNDRQRKQVAIEMVDLEYRRRISNEEGRVAAVLEAEAALMKTKAEGEANIEAKKRLLELDIDKQKRETENYIFDLNRTIDGIRRSTLSLEMDVADYRLGIERKIGEQRRIEEAGQAAGAPATGGKALTTGQTIDKSVLRDWLVKQGFGRTSGDFTNAGHATPNHMLNAMDMGILGGSDADALRKTKDMEKKLAATGAFGSQLFGPTRDPYGHGAGKGGGNIHLHIPTPEGKVKMTPGLAELMGAGGISQVSKQLTTAQSPIKRPVVSTPNVAGVQAGMGEYNEKNAALRKQALSIEQQLQNLREQAALDTLASVARGSKEIQQRKDALAYAKADLATIGAASQDKQELLAFEAQSGVKIKIYQDANTDILAKTKLQGEERKKLELALATGLTYTKQQVELDREALELAQQTRFEKEKAGIQAQLGVTGKGLQAGFIGQAGQAYESEMLKSGNVAQAQALATQTQALELATTKARALEGAYNDIGSATASLMTEGVAGLVAGTTTAQQVFADFLKNIGDSLIKAAQQMIAQYLAIAAAQALANMFSPAAGASGASAGFGMPEIASGFGLGPQRMFADGGRPPVGVPSLVGEKGPELFVPSTAGTIIPAGPTAGIREAMANGNNGNGATAPVLNMSFETTRFGNTDYVSREQLEAAMMQTRAEATKAGARRGMTMTLDKLQQSPSTRSRVGLG